MGSAVFIDVARCGLFVITMWREVVKNSIVDHGEVEGAGAGRWM